MIRRISTLVIVAGVGLLAWTGTVYVWKDPFTTAYTAFEQRRLESVARADVRRVAPGGAAAASRPGPAADRRSPKPTRDDVRREAERLPHGKRVGRRRRAPRDPAGSTSTSSSSTGRTPGSLRRGPGRHLDTWMPGAGELVYIAGHRTTYGAPFSQIDELRRGDPIFVELPYATIEYRVTERADRRQHELSVLKSRGREELVLQACHPRFFASERYLVYARPFQVVGKRGVARQDGVTRYASKTASRLRSAVRSERSSFTSPTSAVYQLRAIPSSTTPP